MWREKETSLSQKIKNKKEKNKKREACITSGAERQDEVN